MSGPTLELGLSAAGAQEILALAEALAALKKELKEIPANALGELQASLKGTPSVASAFKGLVNEIKTAAQQQQTALAELVEVIKKGFSEVKKVTDAGGKAAADAAKTQANELKKAAADLDKNVLTYAEILAHARKIQGADLVANSFAATGAQPGEDIVKARTPIDVVKASNRDLQQAFEERLMMATQAREAAGAFTDEELKWWKQAGARLTASQKLYLQALRDAQAEIRKETRRLQQEAERDKRALLASVTEGPLLAQDAAQLKADTAARAPGAAALKEAVQIGAATAQQETRALEKAEAEARAADLKALNASVVEGQKQANAELAAQRERDLANEADWMARKRQMAAQEVADEAARNATFEKLERKRVETSQRLRTEAEQAYASRDVRKTSTEEIARGFNAIETQNAQQQRTQAVRDDRVRVVTEGRVNQYTEAIDNELSEARSANNRFMTEYRALREKRSAEEARIEAEAQAKRDAAFEQYERQEKARVRREIELLYTERAELEAAQKKSDVSQGFGVIKASESAAAKASREAEQRGAAEAAEIAAQKASVLKELETTIAKNSAETRQRDLANETDWIARKREYTSQELSNEAKRVAAFETYEKQESAIRRKQIEDAYKQAAELAAAKKKADEAQGFSAIKAAEDSAAKASRDAEQLGLVEAEGYARQKEAIRKAIKDAADARIAALQESAKRVREQLEKNSRFLSDAATGQKRTVDYGREFLAGGGSLEDLEKKIGSVAAAAAKAAGPIDEMTRALRAQGAAGTSAANALERVKIAESKFQVATPSAQGNKIIGARAQIEQGVDLGKIREQFGTTAVAIASDTTKLNQALSDLATKHRELHGEASKTPSIFNNAAASMRDAHSAARGLASGFDALYLTYGALIPLLAGAALSNAFVKTIKYGSEVAHTLEIISQLGGNTAAQTEQVKQKLLELASQGPFGPIEVAEAFKTLSLAGLTAQQQISSIKDVLNFSIAGNIGLKESAEGLVAIGTAFGYTADEFNRVGDIISKGAAVSMANVSDFTSAIRTASSVATIYRVSLEDLATETALLTQIGIRGQAAGTAQRNFYNELAADSGKAAKAIKALGIDIYDVTRSRVKDVVQLAVEIDSAFKRMNLSFKGQQEAIRAISNERGGKSITSVLQALRDTEKVDPNVKNRLEEIRKQIVESYGFMIIASANLAVTAKNQMLSVVSAFQTSLVKAFDSIEPTIIVVSERLRTIFNSQEFGQAVVTLASSVANTTVVILEHLDAIIAVVKAMVAWKAATVAFGVVSGALTFIQGLTTAFIGLREALSLLSAEQAVVNIYQAAGGAAAAAVQFNLMAKSATTAGVAMRAFTFAIPVIGTILAVVSAAATAWLLFGKEGVEASVKVGEASKIANESIIKNLDEQAERLREKIKLIKEGRSEAEAAALAESKLAESKFEIERVSERATLQRDVVKAEDNLDFLQRTKQETVTVNAVSQDGRTVKRTFGKNEAIDAARQELELRRRIVENYDAETERQKALLAAKRQEVALLAKEAADAGDARRKANEPKLGTKDFTIQQPAVKNELSAVKAQYDEAKSQAESFYNNEKKLLDEQIKYKLISEADYAVRVDAITRQAYEQETAALETYVAKTKELTARLKSEAQANSKDKAYADADKIIAQLEKEVNLEKSRFDVRRRSLEIEERGKPNLRAEQINEEINKINEKVRKELEDIDIQRQQQFMTEEEIAAKTARNKIESEYAGTIAKIRSELDLLQRQEKAALESTAPDREGTRDAIIAKYEREIAQLKELLARVQNAQLTAANTAERKALEPLTPDWQKLLAGWRNTTKMMRDLFNETMLGIINKMEDAWVQFAQTGKLKLGDVLRFIEAQIARYVFRIVLTPVIEDAIKKLAKIFNIEIPKSPEEQHIEELKKNTSALIDLTEAVKGKKGNNPSAYEPPTGGDLSVPAGGPILTSPTTVEGGTGDFARADRADFVQQEKSAGDAIAKLVLDVTPLGRALKNFGFNTDEIIGKVKQFGGALYDAAGTVLKFIQSLGAQASGGIQSLFGGLFGGGGGGTFTGNTGLEGLSADALAGFFSTGGVFPQAYAKGGSFSSRSSITKYAKGGAFNTIRSFARGGGFDGIRHFHRGGGFDGIRSFARGGGFEGIHNFARGAGFNGITSFAHGDIFDDMGDARIAMFAAGDKFTNQIYDEPRLFRFGSGGNQLGMLGEAGPEAVLPLRRGPDGDLGVKVSGSERAAARAPSVAVQNVTHFVVEQNAPGVVVEQQETTRGDGSKEIRAIITATKNEIAKDILRKQGPIHNALKSNGLNTSSAVVRRN